MSTWVLFAGLPGTGKSTLARVMAQRLGAAVLDKDRVRGALFPGELTDFSPEQDQLCMRAMVEAAVYLTERRRVLVYNHLRMIGHAALLFRTEQGRAAVLLDG